MRVTHISTHDLAGGAARAAYRLHQGLLIEGVDSVMFVARRDSGDPAITQFSAPMDLPHRALRRLRRERILRSAAHYRYSRPGGFELFSSDRVEHGGDPLAQLPGSDVVNMHWIASFVDYPAFFPAVAARAPIVWTLHDMNPFTGGCHYDDGCHRYVSGCGTCPQLGSRSPADLSREIWQRKKRTFDRMDRSRLHVVAPSEWLAHAAAESPILGQFPLSVIPCGLDTEEFAPRDQSVARDTLGIPQRATVLLFVADSLHTRRKGFALLVDALNGLGELQDLFLLSMGEGESAAHVAVPHLHLKHVSNDRFLSLIYSAADLLVIPSLQDNFPNTILESFACGLPVVGFDVGGIPDLVRPGLTGALAPPGDTGMLRAVIRDLAAQPGKRRAMAANCRRTAVEDYSLRAQAKRYSDLYEGMLEACAAPGPA